MDQQPKCVVDILDRLQGAAERSGHLTLGEVMEALGPRSYGPFLFVPAVAVVSPLGAIPALPSAAAVVIALVAAQLVVGRKSLWLPSWLKRRGASAERIENAAGKMRPAAKVLDRLFHGRLEQLVEGPATRIAAAASIVLAATVPPLELLPLAAALPMIAVAAFGLALTVRDGVLMLAATLVAAAAVWLAVSGL